MDLRPLDLSLRAKLCNCFSSKRSTTSPFSIKCSESWNGRLATLRYGSSFAIGQIYSSYFDGDSYSTICYTTLNLADHYAPQANLNVQGVNKLLNNVFNIIRQPNSHMFEERLQRLEVNLHNPLSRENFVQEVTSEKTHATSPETTETKRDVAPGRRCQMTDIRT